MPYVSLYSKKHILFVVGFMYKYNASYSVRFTGLEPRSPGTQEHFQKKWNTYKWRYVNANVVTYSCPVA